MEGDAGASRLTPNDTDEDPSLEPDAVADDPTAEESAEDSLESDDAADQRSVAAAGLRIGPMQRSTTQPLHLHSGRASSGRL